MSNEELAEKIARDITSFLGLGCYLRSKVRSIVFDNLEQDQLPPFDPTKQNEDLIGSDGLSDSVPSGVTD